jgi:hypothetical protein
MRGLAIAIFGPAFVALYVPSCHTPVVRPTVPAGEVRMSELWEQPSDLGERDLLGGQWAAANAPDPHTTFRFLSPKLTGTNPGMTVKDSENREWHVKQAPHNKQGDEGPVEVTLSRVLEALGYHQPPVYYVRSFSVVERGRTRREPGGRFRLDLPSLRNDGEWSWQKNPFVGTLPYQGLLVVLMVFNSSDLKNANNVVYRRTGPDGRVERWYVVRDLGAALGETGRLAPRRGDPSSFERLPFIAGVEKGFVRFDYRGFHQELVRDRITPLEVTWACGLLSELSDRQWRDAFRAGGFDPSVADRFIRRLRAKIAEGLAIGAPSGGA